MNTQYMLTGLTLLLSTVTFNANASLISYAGSGGSGLVYSSVSNLTWTQDANLLGTLESTMGFSTTIDAIIAVSPIIYDTPNFLDTPAFSGHHTVTADDFYTGGGASWFGAKAFVHYLNNINYGGTTQWRLPTSSFNLTGGDELGQLFYDELSGTLGSEIPDTNTFINEQDNNYWSGMENTDDPYDGLCLYGLAGIAGYPGSLLKSEGVNAWPVSPGRVAAVPVPSSAWLMGSGLLGLLGLLSKKRG